MSLARARYRSRQVMHALRPRIPRHELEHALSVLSEGEAMLFKAMERRDQRHALEVAARLRVGEHDADLLVAALLHDCGKGAVPLCLRVLKVLLPKAVERLAHEDESKGWRYAAYRLHAHVEISEQLAREAGVSECAVRLIAGCPHPHEEWKAALLYAADDAS